MTHKMDHRFVFIAGLHRSGTSAVYKMLGSDPRISIFASTGVIEDEGQFLQSVFPDDSEYGGPGLFGFDERAHMREDSSIVREAKARLFNEWATYWDLTKDVLIEKSPANLLRTRFLQQVFPTASFIIIMRHPVATCMATTKWCGAYMTTLIEHWIKCHEILFDDIKHLNRVVVVKYEDLCDNDQGSKAAISDVLGFAPSVDWSQMRKGVNTKYYARWKRGDFHLKGPKLKNLLKQWRNKAEIRQICERYECEVNKYGYSFSEAMSLPNLSVKRASTSAY